MRRALKRKIIQIIKKIKYGKLYEDVIYAQNRFKDTFGYELNLKNPKTFNEKLQWLKLYDRTDLHTLCADKYLVRDHVQKEIGEEYLIPLVFETDKVEDVNETNLPDYPVIVKTNHDCGTFTIIRDKSNQNWQKIHTKLQKSLDSNYYDLGKEWQYKNINPTIVIEKLLIDDNGIIPKDYKFFCNNGKVSMIQLDMDKESSISRNIYDIHWNLLDIIFFSTLQNPISVPRPTFIDRMIILAEKLSSKFIFARIDFYEVNNKIYFGEITFHPSNGFGPISPKSWDLKMGDLIKLPI